ncbi:MAG: GNAT family N-acetyltransferase [Fimbriimonadaceae bacterium]|nr:GNAT family N-acetyltransferase [Fimbriimonadaceae bacterium]
MTEGGEIVACGGFEVLDGCGYLCWGIVDRGRAGKGLGRALLERRLELLRSWPVGSVFSDTAPVTERFFARFGFETFFRRPDHWSPGIDLAAMELSLDGTRRGPGRIRSDGTIGYRIIPPPESAG